MSPRKFGQGLLGVLAAWIEASVLSEPFLTPPDRLEPLARALRIAAERPKAALQRFDLCRGIEWS